MLEYTDDGQAMNLSLKLIYLPLLILAFVGVAITFLAPIFTTSTRWLVLVLVLGILLINGSLWRPLKTRFGMLTLISGIWTLATVMWSEEPLLSGLKGVAYNLIAVTCLGAGFNWVSPQSLEKTLDFLLPLTVAALLAGLLGRYSSYAIVVSGGTIMYQGLVSGPNMFGSMLAMCSPVLVWKTYRYWSKIQFRLIWILLSAIALYYLVAASSRGAILVVLFSMTGALLCLSLVKRVQIIFVVVAVATSLMMVMPGKFEQLQQQYIYKNATVEQGVLHTRETVWTESYEQALKGGLFGGGYGVTIGSTTRFGGGLTAFGYGREKGNSQLALIEETGLVGLFLYVGMVALLMSRMFGAISRCSQRPARVLLGIVTGLLAGMIIGSVFEAWWVAPGSAESAYFWVMAGVGLRLSGVEFDAPGVTSASGLISRPGEIQALDGSLRATR